MRRFAFLAMVLAVFSVFGCTVESTEPTTIKFATVNASLYREKSGELLAELKEGKCVQAQALAAILQTVRPDVVLVNEMDYDEAEAAVIALRDQYLHVGQKGQDPLQYPYYFTAPVNTGVDSQLDLDGDHKLGEPEDAWGFGKYEGQYGMVIFSRFPIDMDRVRTFQLLRWSEMPDAKRPVDPKTSESFYTKGIWNDLRLSSKSHWDVPVLVEQRRVHVLASHPTPPAFDGPEDRNGCRNHDEIRFWSDYLSRESSTYIRDDQGHRGGLAPEELCVVMGDLNADPVDGSGQRDAILQLLSHPRLQDAKPSNQGASEETGKNRNQTGNPDFDTAQFGFGNLRVDYVIPSVQFRIRASGVFWPKKEEPQAVLIESSDHRLVWVTVALP